MVRSTQSRVWMAAVLALVVGLAVAPAAQAAGPLASMSISPAGLAWQPAGSYEKMTLTISGPGGLTLRREFGAGVSPSFEPFAADGKPLPDGAYTYELSAAPQVDRETRRALANARRTGDDSIVEKLRAEGKLPSEPLVQSGVFKVAGGTLVPADMEERSGGNGPAQSKAKPKPVTAADQVIPDDLIVQGSECVGLDCVNNENFGFDTIRLKENNTRIHFDDTSTQAGFPANDWRLIANDSASGGSSKFSIEDSTGAKTPFTITAGAATNSIFVDSTGRLGLRTSTPVLDLHINTSNTPSIRLEQNNSGGFTAQTWDIAGNEANFFVRDVTSGSRLPFRIRPGAPTSSIDISADGEVGIGTASPTEELTVKSDAANGNVMIVQRSQVDSQTIMRLFETTAGAGVLSLFNDVAGETFQLAGSGGHSFLSGTVGVNCNAAGGFTFAIKSGTTSTTACNTGTFSGISPGQTTFTIASSRSIKEDIEPVQVPDILEKIKGVDVYTYNYIDGPKDRLGLMAEDFHQVFQRGSDKLLNGQEVEMALWLAVQELTKRNEELAGQNSELLQRLQRIEARLGEPAAQK